MKKLFIALIAFTALFSACKKKDVEKTVAEKLAGKWKVTSYVSNDYYSGANHPSTTPGGAGDYVDFRADGKVYSKEGNNPEDVSAFSLVNDNTVKIDNEDFTIKAITETQLVLYQKDQTSTTPLEYFEITLNLYK
jgi:outer membrane lipoprotein-sorting protein